jgi:hypothetical protein
MNTHSTRFGLNLVVRGSVAQTAAEAKRAAGSAPATDYQGRRPRRHHLPPNGCSGRLTRR